MKHVVRIGLALFISAVVVPPTFAQEGDAGAGLAVAQDTCAGCHAIHKGQQSANANAPAFEKIVGVPGMTAIALQALLQTSHRSMPDLILSTEDRRKRGCLHFKFETKVSCPRVRAVAATPHQGRPSDVAGCLRGRVNATNSAASGIQVR
jgi:hypothetical protein